ncbi:histidine kinase [Mycobacterium sp. 050128]|uniref:sensor histidine kinase n=1 Tax=Mycobacterium sp. 050128 TaxID=3096112 RepID=UPI002EDA682D
MRVIGGAVGYVRRHAAEMGYDYPVVYFLICAIAQLGSFGLAAGQRVAAGAALIAVLAGAIWAVQLIDYWPKGFVRTLWHAATQIGAAAVLLARPVEKDLAPIVLIVTAVMISAAASFAASMVVTVVAVITLAVPTAAGTLDWGIPYMFGVVWGACSGRMMLMQLRLLWRERDARQAHAGRAASEERRRIAREIHDVVAHSLSITLLNLTVARHALQQDRDIDDAIEALEDAERVGRQAMSDIRLTVGLLGTGPSNPAPEPGIDDIPTLIEDFRRAGMRIRYEIDGAPQFVSATTGLSLYRIVQESLANVAKHAPGAETNLRVDITNEWATVCVTNTASHPISVSHSGSGLHGMRQRAELIGGSLRAGPAPPGWLVQATIPTQVGDVTS